MLPNGNMQKRKRQNAMTRMETPPATVTAAGRVMQVVIFQLVSDIYAATNSIHCRGCSTVGPITRCLLSLPVVFPYLLTQLLF